MKDEMLSEHPDRERCLSMLEEYGTPPHVVRHCLAVAGTALKIAEAMNAHGCKLNLALIQSAGLLHDIARVEDKHWEKGAELAAAAGDQEAAEIIRVHMFHQCEPGKPEVDETDLICLADKLVKEDQFVGLHDRMLYILDKSDGSPEIRERIFNSFSRVEQLKCRIEALIGQSLSELMKDYSF